MEKRQILSVLLVCLLIVALFAGCSKGVYMDAVSNGEAMAPELSGNNKADQTGTDVLQDRKLIRKIHMSAETGTWMPSLPILTNVSASWRVTSKPGTFIMAAPIMEAETAVQH